MKKYFIIALAALGFAACAEKMNDGPSPEQTGEIEQSYIAINLMSSELDTRVNTDAPVLEDGEEAERQVNSVHFFFFRQGVPFAVNATGSAPGGDKNWLTATPNFTEDTEDANISDYSEVTLVLNNYKGQYPDQIVAVINWTPADKEYTLEMLHAELVTLRGHENGFVMSNSVYMSDSKMIDATAIAESNIGEDANEARKNAVDIYVERVAAKVKVSTPAASDADGDWNVEKKWFDTGKTSGLTTLGDAMNKVYVKINNWSLYNARTQSDLLKTINPAWSDAVLGLTWNDIPRFRSYWADADAYTGGTYVNNNNFIWESGNSLGNAEYCGENTASAETERTKLILKGQLVDEAGNAFELVKWNGQEMVKVENLKKAVAAQLKYLVYSYTENAGEKTYTSISDTDLECISGTSQGAPNGVKNYQVYFQLTSDASDDSKKWAIKSGETYEDKDAAQINRYLIDNIPAATVYAGGQTYYYIDIKHLGTSGKGAEYGIVRNHIYDIEIQSIKGYGTPVYSPDSNLVKPETPTDDPGVYVAAKINVLSWRVVKQGVNIEVK